MYMLYHIYISTVFVSGELLVSKSQEDQVPAATNLQTQPHS